MATRIPSATLNVWPAFTDTMLAFVLILVVALAYQVGLAVEIVEEAEQVDWGQQKMREDQNAIRERIQTAGLRGVAVAPTRSVIQEITFGSDVTFQSASADLSPQGLALVKAIASTIVGDGSGTRVCTLREVQVSGHTDVVQTGRSTYSNWELSADRAVRVVRELVRAGVDPAAVRMSGTGYGEFQPVRAASRLNENRRLELRLTYANDREPDDCL